MKAAVLRSTEFGDPVERPVASHRHTSHEHEHDFEVAPGLPEPLPSGERVLWQGAPDWKMLARECFHVRKLAVYFAALVAWRAYSVVSSGAGTLEIVAGIGMAVALAGTALGLATLIAWMSARTTLYTITDRRIVMRVGIVLSVTFNLPFRKVESAALHAVADRHGDIALTLNAADRIAFLQLWPHVRPWRVARTQPNLRCIADAASVAKVLTDAWRIERGPEAAPDNVRELPARTLPSPRATAHPQPATASLDAAQPA